MITLIVAKVTKSNVHSTHTLGITNKRLIFNMLFFVNIFVIYYNCKNVTCVSNDSVSFPWISVCRHSRECVSQTVQIR